MFPGDRCILVCQSLDTRDIAGEESGYCDKPEAVRQREGVPELTRLEKRSIGGPLRLIDLVFD